MENVGEYMLRSLKSLQGYKILARDGILGRTKDFYFDDQSWTIRYLVVDTRGKLGNRKVLISSTVIEKPHWALGVISVDLTQNRIKNSPAIDCDKPVSRQKEREINEYFNWPSYWDGSPVRVPGIVHRPESELEPEKKAKEQSLEETPGDPNLRSSREVRNYHVEAHDGEVGKLEDFIVEDESWIIRYLVLTLMYAKYSKQKGEKVLLSPLWIKKVDWERSKVFVEMTRDRIWNSQKYNPSAPVNREYEVALFDYYGRPKYWLKS